jgi:PleD family two-component response regulator
VSKPIMAADLIDAVDRCTRWDGAVDDGDPSTSRRREVGRTRVLVVEDDQIILDLITTRLDIAGYDTYFARDGFEGLKRLHELRPSALVLDLNMPRLDGFGLLRKMRQEG